MARETFGSHANTAHAWAQGTYSHGRSGDGRMFFRDGRIFSHGTHFTIARILPKPIKGRRVVLWNRETFSISTSRHQSLARDALRGLDYLIIPVWNLDRETDKSKRASLESLVESLAAGGVVESDWRTPDNGQQYRLKIEILRSHYKMRFPIPADPAAWVARRKAELLRARAAAQLAEAKATLQQAEYKTLPEINEGDDSLYRAQDRVKQIDRELTRLRSARLTLAKAGRFKNLVRQSSAHIKRIEAAREPYKARVAELVAQARRDVAKKNYESLLTQFRDFGKVEKISYYIDNGRLADVWAYALAEGDSAFAAWLGDEVQIREWQATIDSYRRYTPWYRKPDVTPDDWHDGLGEAYQHAFRYTLVRRKGANLETSRGAVVAWRDAKRAFLFAQHIRRHGESWHRNGQQFRVGIYQLDSVDSDGNIVAGCHSIPWQEMESCAVKNFEPRELPATFPVPAIIDHWADKAGPYHQPHDWHE